MATIAAFSPFAQVGEFLIAATLTTGADVVTYTPAKKQVLYIRNDSVSPAVMVLDGADVTTAKLPGQGALTDNSAGYTITVAAGTTRAVALTLIKNYLKGVVALTGGGADIFAWVEES